MTTALVLKIVDGDTVDVVDDVRGRLRVRLLGIDTPETKKPNYTVGCWGPEATEFATETLLGPRVALIPDPTQDRFRVGPDPRCRSPRCPHCEDVLDGGPTARCCSTPVCDSGSDVVKALAMGAAAVGIGRPYAYALAVGGRDGVVQQLRSILAEADLLMAIDGYPTIAVLRESGLVRTV